MTARRLGDLSRPERRRAMLHTAALVVAAWVAVFGIYFVVPFDRDIGSIVVQLLLSIVAFLGVAVWEVVRILRSDLPQLRAAEAIGVLVPLFIVLFSAIYLVMSTDGTGQFTETLTHVDALYFTVTVLATVGFGDIAAVTQGARIVVTIQMMLDIAIVATLAKVILGAARLSLGERPS